MINPRLPRLLLLSLVFMTGCIGFGVPQPYQGKPFTMLSKGDQLGRDQIANRSLVARAKVILKGREANDVVTLLGQPQQVQILERHVSEDWYFVYFKNYVPYNPTNKVDYPDEQGEFVVRIYRDKVIDVVKLS
jgi:hypothetical protein